MKIQFSDIYGESTGWIEVKGDKLVGSDENKQYFADEWLKAGKTAEEFVEKYSDYSNGYIWTKAE